MIFNIIYYEIYTESFIFLYIQFIYMKFILSLSYIIQDFHIYQDRIIFLYTIDFHCESNLFRHEFLEWNFSETLSPNFSFL